MDMSPNKSIQKTKFIIHMVSLWLSIKNMMIFEWKEKKATMYCLNQVASRARETCAISAWFETK